MDTKENPEEMQCTQYILSYKIKKLLLSSFYDMSNFSCFKYIIYHLIDNFTKNIQKLTNEELQELITVFKDYQYIGKKTYIKIYERIYDKQSKRYLINENIAKFIISLKFLFSNVTLTYYEFVTIVRRLNTHYVNANKIQELINNLEILENYKYKLFNHSMIDKYIVIKEEQDMIIIDTI